MEQYFNCGDKTHTSASGGMVVAMQAYMLIMWSNLEELKSWTVFPSMDEFHAYAQRIEDEGKKAALTAKGTPFESQLAIQNLQNLVLQNGGYMPTGGAWPAGEIDEVANRYAEYTISAEKKKGMVVERISLPVCAKGGDGMNIHVNFGFGDTFRDVTTIYENTALRDGEELVMILENQPILVPAGETLHIRVLPWYDSNGHPQKGKSLQLGEMTVTGKKLD